MIQISTNGTPRNKVFREYYLKRVAEGKNIQQGVDLYRPQISEYRVWNAEKPYRIPGTRAIMVVGYEYFVLR